MAEDTVVQQWSNLTLRDLSAQIVTWERQGQFYAKTTLNGLIDLSYEFCDDQPRQREFVLARARNLLHALNFIEGENNGPA